MANLKQAYIDASNVAQWMDDNHADDDHVGFATAWAEMMNVLRYLEAAQHRVHLTAFGAFLAGGLAGGFIVLIIFIGLYGGR